MLEADFTSGTAELSRKDEVSTRISKAGEATNVICWMVLQLDEEGDILLTTCPKALTERCGLVGAGVYRSFSWQVTAQQFEYPLDVTRGDSVVLDVKMRCVETKRIRDETPSETDVLLVCAATGLGRLSSPT